MRIEQLFLVALLAFVVYFLTEVAPMAFKAKLVVFVVGVPLLAMILGQLTSITFKAKARRLSEDFQSPSEEAGTLRHHAAMVGWMGIFFGTVLLLGFHLGLFASSLGFYATHKVKWSLALALSFGIVLALYLGIEVALQVKFPRGLLASWLGLV